MQAKKKLTALLLSLCMLLGMLPMTAFAAGETTAEGLVYEVNGESVTITGYTGSEGKVTIPSEIEGKPVTAIGEKAFYQNYTLTSVEIPNSVTSIGTSAFHLCSNLTNVTFEEGSKLSSIGAGAFYWCTKLTDITIPDGVTSIGNSVFYKTGLQNINIPAGVTSIEEGAFWKCDKLESITFEGRTAPVLDGDVFFECTVLTVVNVPCGADGYTEANGWPEDKVQIGHKAEKVDGKAPTATEPGNIEYWYCPQCDTYFKDAGLTEVITKEQTVLAPTGETKPEPSKPDETPAAPTDPPQDKPDKTDDTTESPQTGDSSDMALWIGLMLASCGGVLGMLFYRRKKAAAGK